MQFVPCVKRADNVNSRAVKLAKLKLIYKMGDECVEKFVA